LLQASSTVVQQPYKVSPSCMVSTTHIHSFGKRIPTDVLKFACVCLTLQMIFHSKISSNTRHRHRRWCVVHKVVLKLPRFAHPPLFRALARLGGDFNNFYANSTVAPCENSLALTFIFAKIILFPKRNDFLSAAYNSCVSPRSCE
jgi:hypothetical protein